MKHLIIQFNDEWIEHSYTLESREADRIINQFIKGTPVITVEDNEDGSVYYYRRDAIAYINIEDED